MPRSRVRVPPSPPLPHSTLLFHSALLRSSYGMDGRLRGSFSQEEVPMAIEHRNARPEPLRVRLGKLLREARLAAGLTQRQVAQRVGCPTSRISRVELG